MLEKHGHGGDWQSFYEVYTENQSKAVDFSANINPLGPPEAVREVLQNRWRDVARYPSPDRYRLRWAFADRYGCDAGEILVTNGASEALDLFLQAVKCRCLGVVEPCFSEYAAAAGRAGVRVLRIQTRADEDFAVEKAALEALMQEVDVVILGNPNNPTGKLWDRETLLQLAADAEQEDCFLLVDEAFLDFLPDEEGYTLTKAFGASTRLAVLRSLTKMYAIPGLRLGFLLAPVSVIEAAARLQVPWSVNILAELVGEALFKEDRFVQLTRKWLKEERCRFTRALSEVPGCRVFPMEAAVNFVLLQLNPSSGNGEAMTASTLQERLAREGLFVRNCKTFPGMGEDYIRLAVRRREENERLVRTLWSVFSR